MGIDEDLKTLRDFALNRASPDVHAKDVRVEADERIDGEGVVRVSLLLPDPPGDTWPLESTRELRSDLNRRASELGLPRVTATLVAESEPEAQDIFTPTKR